MKEQIRKYLTRYVEFNDTEIDAFYSKLIVSDYTKKEFLIQEGQLCTHRYFILKGLVRTFYIDNNGNEKITQFALENWWFTDMESFVNETPSTTSTTSIQTLEKTTLLKISKTELELLFLEIPKLERLFRIITEKTLIAIQRKNDVYLRMKNKDIYELFLNQNPEFVQRVPQYMIASYLEMTPEYLSGIRK